LSFGASPTSISPTTQIAETVLAILGEASELRLRAIVLTGSLARDEGTWQWRSGRVRMLGDAEFIVVLREDASFPSGERLNGLVRDIDGRLRAHGILAKIGLSPVRPTYLKALRPHIFAYELIEHGKVIWGDKRVLDLIPRFSPSDIPFEDGFRILLNRLIELLEVVCEAKCIDSLTERVRYRAIKLLLDMATSLLVFERQYESTYRGRATRVAQLVETAGAAPIRRQLAEQVRIATKYKLGESQRSPIQTGKDLLSLVDEVHSVWSWELRRLLGARIGLSDGELLRRWVREQGAIERLRGWGSLAKRYGMRASVKLFPRWIKEALEGSPRRLIYAAGSELFFALPALLDPARRLAGTQGWSQPRWRLPVMSDSPGACSWRRFGCTVGWNYHHFLESTRS
jgi:hypothetical protein